MNGKYQFKVDYSKRDKGPTGKRSMFVFADSYEEVIHDFMLKELCEKVHDFDLLGHGLEENDVKCLRTNEFMSQYSVTFRNDNDNIITEYLVDIEVYAVKSEKV